MVLVNRRKADTIQIGRDVSVTVIRSSNGEVLLRVEATDGRAGGHRQPSPTTGPCH